MTNGSKKRLGGWTRLWLVFSAVWVVGCSAFFFYTAPERESIELSTEEADQYRVDQIIEEMKIKRLVDVREREQTESPFLRVPESWLPGPMAARKQFWADLTARGVPEQEITRQWRTTGLIDARKELAEDRKRRDQAALIARAEKIKKDYQSDPFGDSYYDEMEPTPAMQEALEQKRRSVTSSHLFKFLSFVLLVPMAFFGSGWTVRWVWDGFVKKDA